jgi:hypothetical protein
MSLARGGSIEVGEEVSDCYPEESRGTMGVHKAQGVDTKIERLDT